VKRPYDLNTKGFTLIEAMISLTVGVLFLSAVVSATYFTTFIWKRGQERNDLRLQLAVAMDRMRQDLSLTDRGSVKISQDGSGAVNGFSFASVLPEEGFLPRINDSIAWNKTIAYYLVTADDKEILKRAVIEGYDPADNPLLTLLSNETADGLAELRAIVSAETLTLDLDNCLTTFDGASTTRELSPNTDFGSIKLVGGSHTFKITPTTAGKVAPDAFWLSHTQNRHEAEADFLGGFGWSIESSPDGGFCVEGSSAITRTFNYDEWLESEFKYVQLEYCRVIKKSDRFAVKLETREEQGVTAQWHPTRQLDGGAGTKGDIALTHDNANPYTIRILIRNRLNNPCTMLRFKLIGPTSGSPLIVNEAWFAKKDPSTTDCDFIDSTKQQIYFTASQVQAEGTTDGVGAVGTTGSTSVTIPSGNPRKYIWSNWMSYSLEAGVDYILSMYVQPGGAGCWTAAADGGVNYYTVKGDKASNSNVGLGVGEITDNVPTDQYRTVPIAEQIGYWYNQGIVTSQIFDTKIASPNFNAIVIEKGNGADNINVQIRTADSIAGITGATWRGTGSGEQYVQFRGVLTTADTSYPELSHVWIKWPGPTKIVSVNGQYVKDTDRAKFQVTIDDTPLTKSLQLSLAGTNTQNGQTLEASLSSEIQCRNTGK